MMAMMTVMVAMMRVMFFDDDGHDEHPWHHLWAGGESPVPAWLQAPGEGMNSLPRG